MHYILYFLIYSLLGWGLETAYAFLINRRYMIRRTMLYLPLCPVYGLGAVLLILTLKPVADNFLVVFCGGFLVASAAEYMTAFYTEQFLGVRLWDYRRLPANYNGRVCAGFSLCWGLAAVLFLRFLEPAVAGLVLGMDSYFQILLTTFGAVCFASDLAATLRAYRHFGVGGDEELPKKLPYIERFV